MTETIERVLISEEEIAQAVSKIADQINEDYKGKEIYLLILLKGSLLFASDLMRKINLPVTVNFLRLSSYSGTDSSGKVKMKDAALPDVAGKDVLVVEDIIDTGTTLSYLLEVLKDSNANSIKLCTLLNKKARRERPIDADYECFLIENEFVIGYGLDYNERYRNLPYIGILKLED